MRAMSAHAVVRDGRVRRVVAALPLALSLLGCGSEVLPSDGVRLVIDESVGRINGQGELEIGCGLMPSYGELVADPTFGVAFKGTGAPAAWPRGYTGRRVGTEVEVRNAYGKVVATTGIGVQMIFWAGNGPGEESGAICETTRAEEHLQHSP